MARSRFDELDDETLDNEREEEIEAEESEDDEELLEGEETLEELDVDERGHVRPRRPRHDEDSDPEEY